MDDPTPANQPSLSAAATHAFAHVPIEITVSVGRARPLVRDLLRLRRDAVLPLDRKIEDPVELYIGDRLIGRGELAELQGDQAGQLAVRLTEVADLKEGL
jgi:flagellar motor switch protein FliN